MRWKLLVLASFVAAIGGLILWSSLVIGLFGTARELARHDWVFLASALLPMSGAVVAGVFVYRHTARRRKTQAILAAILSVVFIACGYLIAANISPFRFSFPLSRDRRHARWF